MPPSFEDRLRDILGSIAEIEELLATTDIERFRQNKTHRMAVERYLEIICEAARRLPDDTKLDQPDIDWQAMNNFANQLRHAYHQTDFIIVWNIVQNHLPPLKAFVESRIRE